MCQLVDLFCLFWDKMALRSIWKKYIVNSDSMIKPPEKDAQMAVVDSLMAELDSHIKLTERLIQEAAVNNEQIKTGVNYSWLVSNQTKQYGVPQLLRLELEELCYKVHFSECGKVINLFRDALLRSPNVSEIPSIMRACIIQTLEQRPKEETMTEWITRRTPSFTNLRLRSSSASKVTPIADWEDF